MSFCNWVKTKHLVPGDETYNGRIVKSVRPRSFNSLTGELFTVDTMEISWEGEVCPYLIPADYVWNIKSIPRPQTTEGSMAIIEDLMTTIVQTKNLRPGDVIITTNRNVQVVESVRAVSGPTDSNMVISWVDVVNATVTHKNKKWCVCNRSSSDPCSENSDSSTQENVIVRTGLRYKIQSRVLGGDVVPHTSSWGLFDWDSGHTVSDDLSIIKDRVDWYRRKYLDREFRVVRITEEVIDY